jgi:serine/threonine protein kinase
MHALNPPVIHRDVKTGNVLLKYADCAGAGAGAGAPSNTTLTAKVSDFGTTRVNLEQIARTTLRTTANTHAVTRQVCGTTPYMPSEYQVSGHVSARTDSFAFGIMAIELMTGLEARDARVIVDDSTFDELPAAIEANHNSKDNTKSPRKCRWSPAPLKKLAKVAAKCVRVPAKLRATIAEVLLELEDLV